MLQAIFIKDKHTKEKVVTYINKELQVLLNDILKDYEQKGKESSYYKLYEQGQFPVTNNSGFKTDLILLKSRVEMSGFYNLNQDKIYKALLLIRYYYMDTNNTYKIMESNQIMTLYSQEIYGGEDET